MIDDQNAEEFLPGELVEVAWDEDDQRIAYHARILGPADRQGDYVVQVVNAGPGSKAVVGAVYAPILGDKVHLNRLPTGGTF